MNTKKEFLKIKEAAQYLGVTTQTLRNWDKAKTLIPETKDPKSGYRYYSNHQLDQHRSIQRGRVFIIGSGFSKQLTSGTFPTEKELLSGLRKEINNEKNLIRHIQGENDHIEAILSRIELDNTILQPHKMNLKQRIYKNFQQQLSIKKFYTLPPEKQTEAKKLVKTLFKPGDTVILMNWDIILEHLLCLLANPTTGENNKPFNYGPITSMVSSTFQMPENPSITILKPHGSFNFYPLENETCMYALMNTQHATFYDSIDPPASGLFPGYQDINLGVIGSGTLSTEVVLPTFVKSIRNTTFAKLWMYAEKAMSEAEKLIIIGYSFPLEDGLMMQTLHNSLWREKTKHQSQGYKRDLPIHWLNSENAIKDFKKSAPIPIFKDNARNTLFEYSPEKLGTFDNAYEALIKGLNE